MKPAVTAEMVTQISFEIINTLYFRKRWKGETELSIFSKHFVLNSDNAVFEAELFSINEALKQLINNETLVGHQYV